MMKTKPEKTKAPALPQDQWIILYRVTDMWHVWMGGNLEQPKASTLEHAEHLLERAKTELPQSKKKQGGGPIAEIRIAKIL